MTVFSKSSLFLLLLSFLLINGCSKEEEKTVSKQPKQNHILKNQVQALEKAKDVERVLINAENNRRKIIDE